MANSQELTTFIALFHHRDHAAAAIRDLEAKGFASNSMTVINGAARNDGTSVAGAGEKAGYNATAGYDEQAGYGEQYGYGKGADLNTIGVPDRDRQRLQNGLDQGGTVLMLEGNGERADEIDTIFQKYSEKIDETDIERPGYLAPVAAAAVTAPIVAAPIAAPIQATTSATDSAVIPVIEEELVVGKRAVDRGGVRVFSRVVEEPVTASVSLREEHVVVDRRPVDRAVTASDLRQGDQVLELTEMREEAVVGKTAKVVEEVLIDKQATNRSETIQDSVRRTEVDVQEVAATKPVIPIKSNDKY